MIYIYILKDPISKEIRYVGKTNNVKSRLFNHLYKAKKQGKKTHIQSWINNLLTKDLIPEMEVIEVCKIDNWAEKEIHWITYYKEQGCKLCNHTKGGEGGIGGFVDVEDKLLSLNKAIKDMISGMSQTQAEISNGLYKGFLSQLRRGNIPYLVKYNITVPKSDYKGHIENIKKFSFKKGRINPNKGKKLS